MVITTSKQKQKKFDKRRISTYYTEVGRKKTFFWYGYITVAAPAVVIPISF